MIKKLLLLILPFSATAQQNFTDDSVFIRHLANETMVNGKAYDLLKHLSKNIGGRLAGSEAYAKAAKWGKQTLEQLGADTVFLQAAKVPNWKRGKNDFCYISAIDGKKQNKPLAMLALGNTIGNAPAIAKGNVMVVNSFAELEERKAEVKGKIVLYQVPFNQANILPGKSYGETGMYRSTGASRAAKYGAIAVMVRSLSSVNDNHPHTGNQRYNDSFPKIPAVALGALDADNLAALCAKQTVEVSLQTHGKMLPDAIDYNVVAEWRGTEQPNKYLLVGGHLDSWDVNEGAHDDGTGIVQTMEVLRSLKAMKYRPKHSIRFVLFANEENGIKGAQAYADSAKKRNEQHVFALESDMGGFTPRYLSFSASDKQLEKLQLWQPLLAPYGIQSFISGGGGADIAPLKPYFGTLLSGYMPDNQRYFDLHHAATDVFEMVNKRELHLGAVNMAAIIYLVDKYGL